MGKFQSVHIPYKGTSPAITDTIAGQTQILFGSVAATLVDANVLYDLLRYPSSG